MAAITLRNIPDDLYERLKRAAEAHHRSINGEVIHCIELALRPRRLAAEERIARLRRLRRDIPAGAVDADDIRRAIADGRP